ncbi:MAG TPA: hypothetical protein VLQ89_08695, partial [Candidatus Binatia bacterium]|nr:hypothetical protein [Candidatus Binatia bacterium]
MKFIDKSRSFKYTLLFGFVFVFSFAAAYCLTNLLEDPQPVENKPDVDRRQLFQNYRFLEFFLAVNPTHSLSEIDAADRNNSLMMAIERLGQAQKLSNEKKYDLSSAILAKIPDQFPYIAAKRDELQLKSLYAENNYKAFIVYHDTHSASSLEIKILLLNSLLKNNQMTRAEEEFKGLFKNRNLSLFSKMISRPALQALLKSLDETFWFDQFLFLLETNAKVEFRQESPHCPYRSLVRLFKAEFAYLSRDYAQSKKLLQGSLGEKYQPFAEKILLKIAVRVDPQADIVGRLQAIKIDSRLYPELMFDAAQILLSKKEFEKALPFFLL